MAAKLPDFASQDVRDKWIQSVHMATELSQQERTTTFNKFVSAIEGTAKDPKIMEHIRTMLVKCRSSALYCFLEANLPAKLLLSASRLLTGRFDSPAAFATTISSIIALTFSFLREDVVPPSPSKYDELGPTLREFSSELMKRSPQRFEWCLCILDILKLVMFTAPPQVVASRREFWVLLNDCCTTFSAFPSRYQPSIAVSLADTVPAISTCRLVAPQSPADRESKLESELCLSMFMSSLHALSIGEIKNVSAYHGIAELSVGFFPRVVTDVEASTFPCCPALPLACLLHPQYTRPDWSAEHKHRIRDLTANYGIQVSTFTNALENLLVLEATLDDTKTKERWFNYISVVFSCLQSLALVPNFAAEILKDPNFKTIQNMIETSTLIPQLLKSGSPGISRMFSATKATSFGPAALFCPLAGPEALSLLKRRCLAGAAKNPAFPDIAAEWRSIGNEEFKAKRYESAIYVYSAAADMLDARHLDLVLLYSNRSQCFLSLEKPQQALTDANAALLIQPGHDKSLVRREKAKELLEKQQQDEVPPLGSDSEDDEVGAPHHFHPAQPYGASAPNIVYPDLEDIDEDYDDDVDFSGLPPLLSGFLSKQTGSRPANSANADPRILEVDDDDDDGGDSDDDVPPLIDNRNLRNQPAASAPASNGNASPDVSSAEQKKKKKKKNKKKKKKTAAASPAAAAAAPAAASSSSSANGPAPAVPPGYDESSTECPICMDNKKNAALPGCGHVFCYDCASSFVGKGCPLCKAEVKSVLRIFL
eukprot:TRINITY_DN6585_c0_g1_i1.p1 TRINITY_DN6585_c0_g1~~TRINITY_DN6585_c0_g1_i1.p1  ORF type:complete len:767 (-),score=178.79 TRINITY_DN6585_c0_g1_i1:859-3159(-)